MAVLPDPDRIQVWAEAMRKWSDDREILGPVLKADIRAAVDALDQFMSDNQATVNNAIPQPARSGLTTKQKALLLMYVIQKRYIAEV